MSDRWLYAWGLASMGLGGASVIVSLYVVELGGGPVTLGVLAAVALGGALAPTVAMFVAIGLAWAAIAVTSGMLVTRPSPATVRGEALGVYSALSSVASGTGGVLGGWVAAAGYRVAFAVAGGFVLVGAAVVLVLRWRVARPTADTDRTADAATGGE